MILIILMRRVDALVSEQPADARMAAFWRWHAGEELEHKSVAFDVYRAVAGNYLERIGIMLSTTLIFQAYLLLNLARFLRADGQLWSRAAWREAFGVGRFDRQAIARVRRDYCAYFWPGFHPQQLDSQPGLSAFKSQLQTSTILDTAWKRRAQSQPTAAVGLRTSV